MLRNFIQNHFCIIIPAYNAENYIERCIRSVAQQDYDNYHVYIVNDASTDKTLEVAIKTINKLNLTSKFSVLSNPQNMGAVFNQVHTIKKYCTDHDIVMLLDGDDWLVNDPEIFHQYNNIYHKGAEFTYGSSWSVVDEIPLISQPYPPEVKQNRSYREYAFNWHMPYTHFRTFKAKLLLSIPDSHFHDENGTWFREGGDNAVFYNILENANPDKVVCVPDIVYNYNDANPLNDYKVNGVTQNITAEKIRNKKPTSKLNEDEQAYFESHRSQNLIKDGPEHDMLLQLKNKGFTPDIINDNQMHRPSIASIKCDKMFKEACNTPSNINEHLPILKELANECNSVTEFGVDIGNSSTAFLSSFCEKITSYDIYLTPEAIEKFRYNVNARLEQGNSLEIEIEPTDMLFIDTLHNYEQLKQELFLHHEKVRKYIVLHDTETYGMKDENGQGPGLISATVEFLQAHPEWFVKNNYTNNNGLTVLQKRGTENEKLTHHIREINVMNPVTDKKFSVIIPTMWRAPEVLLKALFSYVDHPLVDEIIVINNDVSQTPDWAIWYNPKIKVLMQKNNIYVNPAWNLGVQQSKNDLLAIVNDDIYFDPKLFDKLVDRLTPDVGVHGIIAGEAKFNQPATTDGSIDFMEWRWGDIVHNFGQAMFLHKDTWVPIIPELEIYFGDDFVIHSNLHHDRKVWMIYNIHWESPLAATTSDKELVAGFYDREKPHYYAWEEKHPVKEWARITRSKQATAEAPKVKKILIGIPVAKYVECETFKSIYDLEIPDGYEVDFQTFYGYNVDQVRNLIAKWTIDYYDYLFSVDYDIVLPKDALKKMLAHDKDLVSGVYRQRLDQQILELYDSNMNRVDWENIQGQSLVPIGGCGFGCVLVKKEVFVNVGYPQFKYHSALDHSETFSEDFYFCNRAKEAGHLLYCDPSILCKHKDVRFLEVS
jgi:glycosyltransferase involved in cell wall biosynthesis